MTKGSLIIFKDTKRNGIYFTKATTVLTNPTGASTTKIDAILKWHNRLTL